MPTQTVSQLSLNPALLEKLFWLVKPDHTLVNSLLDKMIDVELSMELDEAINDLVSEVIKQAFIAGWKACKNPESLIFQLGV